MFLLQYVFRGLSASSAGSLINALLYYYGTVLKKEAFEIELSRPKKAKKLPAVQTMAECYSIFNSTKSPNHKLICS